MTSPRTFTIFSASERAPTERSAAKGRVVRAPSLTRSSLLFSGFLRSVHSNSRRASTGSARHRPGARAGVRPRDRAKQKIRLLIPNPVRSARSKSDGGFQYFGTKSGSVSPNVAAIPYNALTRPVSHCLRASGRSTPAPPIGRHHAARRFSALVFLPLESDLSRHYGDVRRRRCRVALPA